VKLVNFKAEPADYERWKKIAETLGLSFGEWVRRRLNQEETLVAPRLLEVAARMKGNQGCDHRIPNGTYCKRCGVIKR
jgi:hypothetical protein